MSEENKDLQMTPEQIAELQKEAQEAKTLREALAKRDEALKEYESDDNSKNWRAMRESKKLLIKALRDSGKSVDDDGNILDDSRVSPQDLEVKTNEIVEKRLIEKEVLRYKRDMTEEESNTFDSWFKKATYGETLTSENVDKFAKDALRMAGVENPVNTTHQRHAGTAGGPPVFEEKRKDFADTPEAESVAPKFGFKLK